MTGAEIVVLAGGALTAVAGGLSSAQEARAMKQKGLIDRAQGDADQKIAKYNAKLAERQGRARLDAAKMQSDRMSRQQRIVEATNAAIGAKSGISISESKSSIEVLADTAFQFHMDRNLILNQGMQDYVQMQNQASLLRAEGAFAKSQSDIAYKASKQAYNAGMTSSYIQFGSAAFQGAAAGYGLSKSTKKK